MPRSSNDVRARGATRDLSVQRRELPDAPGVYLFRNRAGEALYVGKANSIRKRVASHFAVKGAGRGSGMGGTAELIDRTDSIEFLVTQNEPEALLAEQSFIKRYRPRFNIRLRDDKSYPYVGVSLDEEFPRVYFTRERHRPNRVYFGPFSSAKRVREALDLLGKLFQYRTCEGPEPGRPLPRLLHKALPGALCRLHRQGRVPGQHRPDHRLPLRAVQADRGRPRGADAGGLRGAGLRAGGALSRPAQ